MSEVSMNLGRVSLVPRGEYDPEAVYNRLDVVRRSGSSYLALKDGLTGVLPIDGEDWMCLVERSGKSAYEQAVDAGLTATEAEFSSALARAVTAFGDWSSGLTPEEEIDPEIVYERTRPVDWMKMPALEDVQDGEFWLLFQWVPGYMRDCAFIMRSNSDIKLEAGRYEDGEFTAQEKYTQDYHPNNANTNVTVTISLDDADFGDMTSEGRVQAMVRISGELTYVSANSNYPQYVDGIVNAGELRELILEKDSNLIYFAIVNMSDHITNLSFYQNTLMKAVRGTFSSVNSFSPEGSHMFGNCRMLVAIPTDATFAEITRFFGAGYDGGIFASCRSLRRLPEGAVFASAIDVTAGSGIRADMFNGCYSLLELPSAMTFEGVTNGRNAFQYCYALRELPPGMTLENLTNGQSMFQNCYALRELPSGMTLENLTNGQSMFQNCYALRELPSGMTLENLTNGQSMFAYCYALRELPSGMTLENLTNGQSMFDNCYALRELPSASFPLVENLSYAFRNCRLLPRINNLYIPMCSNLNNAFNGCEGLREFTFDPRMETWETPQDIVLTGSKLSHEAIVNLFNSLPTIETPKTITLTSNPGASEVTAEDVAIATEKGWKVAGVPAGIATASPGVTDGPDIFDDVALDKEPYFVDQNGNEYYGPFYKR